MNNCLVDDGRIMNHKEYHKNNLFSSTHWNSTDLNYHPS